MKKMVFLILHYINIEETFRCVDSIEKQIDYDNYEIVIVDNGSNNGTGTQLKNKYKSNKKIHIILSKENLGFAKGNNIGFKYAKEELKADYIIMINSDVYMVQNNFCDLIESEYNDSNFAVLGPRILLKNNRICDYIDKLPSIEFLKKRKRRLRRFLFFNKIYLEFLYTLFYRIKLKFFSTLEVVDTSIKKEDAMINGCCIIFSKNYIDKFDGLDDRTFLYYEEFLLYMKIKKNNLKSVYNPYLFVFHNESSSTNKNVLSKRKKINFILKNELASIDIVINDFKENQHIYK